MARFCRACGGELKNADGSIDYDHQFCPGKDCYKKDLAAKLRDRRIRDRRRGRCSMCSQKILHKDVWKMIRSLARRFKIKL